MDEVLFRSSKEIENFQVRLGLAASHSKDIFRQFSQQSKSIIVQAWNGPYSLKVKTNIRELWQLIIDLTDKFRNQIWVYLDPKKIYYNLAQVFWNKWNKRDVCFLVTGFICGGIVGVFFALSIRKKNTVVRYMQAIQCSNYLGTESAVVVENAVAPDECGDNDVIIDVKAASIQLIDAQICSGYGRTLRKHLRKLQSRPQSALPLTLGRDCTGIITDMGLSVNKRLEIGDAVWVTVPFWFEGTLSQSVIVPENYVGKKPKNVGFEGACSIPYAGTLALGALKDARIDSGNALHHRVLIVGGCSPVGCVLVQILKFWKAHITVTCYKRAVPVAKALGSSDIIAYPEQDDNEEDDRLNVFIKELELRDKFDCIFVARDPGFGLLSCLNNFTNSLEGVVSTLAEPRMSDSFGFIGGQCIGVYLRLKYLVEKLFGFPLSGYDEAHMCYVTLDELSDYVENGYLQTVVDKVLHPHDIEIALNHVQSNESIGSTVITFR